MGLPRIDQHFHATILYLFREAAKSNFKRTPKKGRLELNSPSECLYFRGERVLSVL